MILSAYNGKGNMSEPRCWCCGVDLAENRHNYGCRERVCVPQRTSPEWMAGFEYGYADKYMSSHELDQRSFNFQAGYLAGRNAVQEEIDAASEYAYSYHRDEY